MFEHTNELLRCGHCHWVGAINEVGIELVNDGVGYRCPSCQRLLRAPERLAPRRGKSAADRFRSGPDTLAGSPFRSVRIRRD